MRYKRLYSVDKKRNSLDRDKYRELESNTRHRSFAGHNIRQLPSITFANQRNTRLIKCGRKQHINLYFEIMQLTRKERKKQSVNALMKKYALGASSRVMDCNTQELQLLPETIHNCDRQTFTYKHHISVYYFKTLYLASS